MRVACVLMLVACGRLGFDKPRDGAVDAGADDGGGIIDGPPNNPDAMDTMVTLGENTSSTITGVTRDTYISQIAATANFGGADNLRLERDQGARGLVAFSVTSIPATAIVLSARLRFVVEVAAAGATISLHEVNEAWDEGSVDGTMGIANYTFRTGLLPWSLVGAYPPSIGTAVIASASGATLGMVEVSLPVDLVQRWVTTPGTNFGVLLESTSDQTVRLVSSEGADGLRPVLSVAYE